MLKPLLTATQALEIIHSEPFFGPDSKWHEPPALPRPDEIVSNDLQIVYEQIAQQSTITVRERLWLEAYWLSVQRKTEYEKRNEDIDDKAYELWITANETKGEQGLPQFKEYWDDRTQKPTCFVVCDKK